MPNADRDSSSGKELLQRENTQTTSGSGAMRCEDAGASNAAETRRFSPDGGARDFKSRTSHLGEGRRIFFASDLCVTCRVTRPFVDGDGALDEDPRISRPSPTTLPATCMKRTGKRWRLACGSRGNKYWAQSNTARVVVFVSPGDPFPEPALAGCRMARDGVETECAISATPRHHRRFEERGKGGGSLRD